MALATDIKVLQVGDFPPPNGGVATHVEELLRAVREQGGQCEVLDVGKGQLPADGVTPAGGIGRFSALLAKYAARGFRIHLHTSGSNPKSWMLASVCAAAGRFSGLAPFLSLHSGLMPAWLAQSVARRAVARAVTRQFGKVIAVSGAIRDSLESTGLPRDRIEVLAAFSHRFVRPGAPPPGLSQLRAEAAPLFCAMVAPRPEYGEPVLLDAFARVLERKPSARLALYGPGSESVRAPGVHPFGELHRPHALALIAACDVFVRPTLADGDSVSVREALVLGRRVVATAVGNRPPEVTLVPPGDAAALAEALVAVSDLPAIPAPKPMDGFARILALYSEAQGCRASAAS